MFLLIIINCFALKLIFLELYQEKLDKFNSENENIEEAALLNETDDDQTKQKDNNLNKKPIASKSIAHQNQKHFRFNKVTVGVI